MPCKKGKEELENTIVLYAEYMLSNILISMRGGNTSYSAEIGDIAYKQTNTFKKELEKFNPTDLQNIVVASLGFEVSDVQGILENKVAK
ncbi:hypothetical protein wVul_1184 [Wolbachia endosymbiont of Armadillidium vulgare str. wVulC]|uniref:hypothetical protein n=1 Tax=Wolbachia endosymbiont of Armadillidium vulgare TaxID=77039 RepID=UPI00064B55D5|nr:hypothetical protein [Wolbachia endosymbiont of Armadillidium vulgare]KLT22250.1 hypothetical protein wVul_1184 [Wolbachia endosymbiont of Armadillidium vulgare str. wVulC]OJH32172.1 hypothetical protein Wxf_01597 [Wolbachia endosymbiont of Armadillidium vulgare]OJH33031.1 hypothetical protein Wxf_02497 [Wolbachia endosymbiont of Armadillidium vulgare]